MLMQCLGENRLSFIETSALDASNVELAFQNILTGMDLHSRSPAFNISKDFHAHQISPAEIYQIVSSKALDSGDGAQATIGAGTNISLSKAADDGSSKANKCC
jgi:Ras-related protein Rab-11A